MSHPYWAYQLRENSKYAERPWPLVSGVFVSVLAGLGGLLALENEI